MLVVISILGIMAAVAVPAYNGVVERSREATTKRHAQDIADISAQLAAVEVIHVIPVSMGGVEATARYIREGITVYDGPFAGKMFKGPSLTDDEIAKVAVYLQPIYEADDLRLAFYDPGT